MGVQDLERGGLVEAAEGSYPVDGVAARFVARPRSVS